MFASSVAFVDLETTGTAAAEDRVTEVGVVRVDDGECVSEWGTLVNPQCSIPPEIQALTGISNAMVARAPTFAQIADELTERIGGCVFVAHNARFDYGFLKHEFGRLRRAFTAQVLCTVKLSRRLYPEAARHNLDTIVERHGLAAGNRHRALGDARLLWEFAQCVYREKSEDEVSAAVARILRRPSLPPQLPADALSTIPESPGVYFFYGLNALPLYIGKSVNLRERVGAHFSSDYRSANDLRLSAEITRIEVQPTAGELGALLRESQLIKTLLPAYNQRLRSRSDMVALSLCEAPAPPDYVRSAAIDPGALQNLFGPFSSRASARATLRELAAEAGLCWTALGLERRVGPCFARQVRRCRGACVGEESAQTHGARLREALSSLAFKRWPYPGAISVCERDLIDERCDVHVFQGWCWLGTAHDDAELAALTDAPPRATFDLDIYRLLAKALPRLEVAAIH
ncbi:MAG: exonuclease domain-containing protein [Betaproteobacteria bacterium]